MEGTIKPQEMLELEAMTYKPNKDDTTQKEEKVVEAPKTINDYTTDQDLIKQGLDLDK